MKKFLVIDQPKEQVRCTKCGGKVNWFGYFSVHDLNSVTANGYCNDCDCFCTADKESVYGKMKEVSLKEMKKVLGFEKGKSK